MHAPCELIDTVTVDGIRLHGAWHAARGEGPLSGWVVQTWHGVGGNFYSSHLFRDATLRLVELGADVVWTNNRGHDGWSIGPSGPRKGCGAAFETVSDCRQDAAAWSVWIERQLGDRRLMQWGHSLGAVKILYAAAMGTGHHTPDLLVASSPPLLSYERFCVGAQQAPFLEAIAHATSVAAEDPERLIRVSHPFPLWISASAYLDKYGPGERYDLLRFVEQISAPVLFTYGELELKNPTDAFAEVEARLAALCDGFRRSLVVIPRANHFYAHGAVHLGEEVVGFLEQAAGR